MWCDLWKLRTITSVADVPLHPLPCLELNLLSDTLGYKQSQNWRPSPTVQEKKGTLSSNVPMTLLSQGEARENKTG